jgi:hypothetical protein
MLGGTLEERCVPSHVSVAVAAHQAQVRQHRLEVQTLRAERRAILAEERAAIRAGVPRAAVVAAAQATVGSTATGFVNPSGAPVVGNPPQVFANNTPIPIGIFNTSGTPGGPTNTNGLLDASLAGVVAINGSPSFGNGVNTAGFYATGPITGDNTVPINFSTYAMNAYAMGVNPTNNLAMTAAESPLDATEAIFSPDQTLTGANTVPSFGNGVNVAGLVGSNNTGGNANGVAVPLSTLSSLNSNALSVLPLATGAGGPGANTVPSFGNGINGFGFYPSNTFIANPAASTATTIPASVTAAGLQAIFGAGAQTTFSSTNPVAFSNFGGPNASLYGFIF